MSDVVERMRMALAEVGYAPEVVTASPTSASSWRTHGVPWDVAWRAGEVASANPKPICYECATHANRTGAVAGARHRCNSERRFEQDCGVDRSPVGCREDAP